MKAKRTLLIILALILAVEVGFIVFQSIGGEEAVPTEHPTEATVPSETAAEAFAEETEMPTETLMSTEAPTELPTEAAPVKNSYILTFTGDCTLGSTAANWNASAHFIKTIGENYDYPFANVREYFENDDFTMINLEGVLTESGTAASKRFAFRGPTAYTQIMTGSSVEAVTLANNHTLDYGTAGYKSTTTALTEAGIAYVEKDSTAMVVTEDGLRIGLYAASFDIAVKSVKNGVAALKKDGADIIICAFHWGEEGKYRPNKTQQTIAKAAIDAGANIVYGNHPHVLEKIEEYKDGIIYYSLGNFSFGGAVFPQDYDTALLQQEIIRGEDGKFSLGELTIIPCSISSMKGQNNFQPTPMEEGTKEYERVLSKLDGSFKGADLNVDYSKLDPTTPPATQAPSGGEGDNSGSEGGTGGESGGSTGGESGGSSGGSTGGESGGSTGGESGGSSGGSTGGDSGGSSGGSTGGESGGSSGGSTGGESGGSSGGSTGGESGGSSGGSTGGESGGSSGGSSGGDSGAPAGDSGSISE